MYTPIHFSNNSFHIWSTKSLTCTYILTLVTVHFRSAVISVNWLSQSWENTLALKGPWMYIALKQTRTRTTVLWYLTYKIWFNRNKNLPDYQITRSTIWPWHWLVQSVCNRTSSAYVFIFIISTRQNNRCDSMPLIGNFDLPQTQRQLLRPGLPLLVHYYSVRGFRWFRPHMGVATQSPGAADRSYW